jgi:hypothetical protein
LVIFSKLFGKFSQYFEHILKICKIVRHFQKLGIFSQFFRKLYK